MATELEICNEALTSIGENTITALDDSSKASRLCVLKYASKRDYLLRKYAWSFAKKRATLSPDSDTEPLNVPVYEFSEQFTLPSDCLQLVELYPNNIVYNLEGNKILCDESTLNIKYIYQVTDTTEMDSIFVEALSALLARELAIPLSVDKALSRQMDELYELKISEARFAGSIEQDLESIEANDWIDSRY